MVSGRPTPIWVFRRILPSTSFGCSCIPPKVGLVHCGEFYSVHTVPLAVVRRIYAMVGPPFPDSTFSALRSYPSGTCTWSISPQKTGTMSSRRVAWFLWSRFHPGQCPPARQSVIASAQRLDKRVGCFEKTCL